MSNARHGAKKKKKKVRSLNGAGVGHPRGLGHGTLNIAKKKKLCLNKIFGDAWYGSLLDRSLCTGSKAKMCATTRKMQKNLRNPEIKVSSDTNISPPMQLQFCYKNDDFFD